MCGKGEGEEGGGTFYAHGEVCFWTGKICEVVKRICEIWGVGIKPLERKT